MKLFKIKTLGIKGGSLPINPNIRKTITYDDVNQTVKVEIDKVSYPDLEDTQDPAKVIYTNIASRTFGFDDFPRLWDNIRWYVDYDVVENKILEPQQYLDFFKTPTKAYAPGALKTSHMNSDFYKRTNENLICLFEIYNFDAKATDLSNSYFVLYTVETGDGIHDTIINTKVPFTEITQDDFGKLRLNEIISKFTFSITDSNGVAIDPSTIVPVPAKNDSGEDINLVNEYKVSLAPGKYTVKVTVDKPSSTLTNTYLVSVVNGVTPVSKVDIASGELIVPVDLTGLQSGIVSRLKFQLGDVRSYAKLWMTIK